MKERYFIIDTLRGINIISMIIFHLIWDLVYLFGVNIAWFCAGAGFIWQQSICCLFILLSGFCSQMGKNRLRRAAIVSFAGLLISFVSAAFLPDEQIIFGVLTFIGSCMFIMIPLDKILKKWNPILGLSMSFVLFVLTREVNDGSLMLRQIHLPRMLYKNMLTAYIGFPPPEFVSDDYFSLLPWMFLFLSGYFLYGILKRKNGLNRLVGKEWKVIGKIGRHSLCIYLLHQPVLVAVLYVIFMIV